MLITMILAFFAVVGIVLTIGSRVSVVSILVLQLTASVVGMWILADAHEVAWPVFVCYAMAIAALAAGRLACRLTPERTRPLLPSTLPHLSAPVMWSLVIVSSAFAGYHLLLAGIPILTSNVEIQRFDFTSSGFFGIPGRMFLFGLKITWVVAAANAAAQRIPWTAYPPWIAASVSLLGASLASGFKGQILSLALTCLLVWLLTNHGRLTYWTVARRFWPLGAAAVGYFLLVAGQYSTYQAAQVSILQSAFNRWTIGSAETPAVVLNGGVVGMPTNPLMNDILYYAWRYAGIRPGTEFSTERAVSASITGVDPATQVWVVPVNVGGYAELVASFGVPAAIVGMLIVGWVLGRIELLPPAGTIGTSVRIVAVLMIIAVVVKGGLVYVVVNWSAVAAMLVAVGLFTHMLFDRRSPGRYRPPRRAVVSGDLPSRSVAQ